MKNKSHGFTLIEMMVTIAIIAILASISIPSFQSTINSQRQNSNYQELLSVFNTARSQALTLKSEVVVNLNSNSGNTAFEFNWAPEKNNTLVESTTKKVITFNPSGTIKDFDSTTTTFSICNSYLKKSKRVQLTRMGSVKILSEGSC